MTPHYVIIGAGHAGRRMAESLRDADSSAAITLIGEENEIPYDRPSLSKEGLVTEEGLLNSFVQSNDFYTTHHINLVLGVKAEHIDTNNKEVTLHNQKKIPYDALFFTTGSRIRTVDVPGAAEADIHYVRTIADSRKLRAAAQNKKNVTIIGGGFIGLEVAATLANHFNCHVTLLESGSRILKRTMPEILSAYMHQLHEQNGITIQLNTQVERIENSSDGKYIIHTNHGIISTELIVAGIGVHPNQELAALAGVKVNNGILVDEQGRTNMADLYAAGDVTAHYSPFYQAHIRLESWQVAENQPLAVAQALYGDTNASFTDLPWLWSDQYDHNLQMLGDFCFAHQVVIRQEADPTRFAILGLNDQQQIKAVCTVNQGRDMSMYKRLMQAGCAAPTEMLSDSSTPLRSLQHLLRN